MKFQQIDSTGIVEIISDNLIISTAEDGLDVLGNVYYQGYDKIILRTENIIPAFFDLRTGMAGEILQKFSNYRVRLAVVGDFSHYASKSLQYFIRESNSGKQVNFVGSTDEAVERLMIN